MMKIRSLFEFINELFILYHLIGSSKAMEMPHFKSQHFRKTLHNLLELIM